MAFAPPPVESLVEEDLPVSKAPDFFNPPPADSIVPVEKDPNASKFAIQEIPTLTKVGARMDSALEKAGLNIRRMADSASDFLHLPEVAEAFGDEGTFRRAIDNNLRYYNERENKIAQQDAAMDGGGFGMQVVEGLTRGVAELPLTLLPGAAAKKATDAVKIAAAAGGTIQGLSTYGQERGDGKTFTEAAPYAITSGLITALTTKAFGATGVESVFRKDGVAGIGSKILSVLKDAGLEGAEEAVDQLQQDFIERVARNPDKPISQSFNDVLMAGTIGSLIGGMAAGVKTGLTPDSRPSDFEKMFDAAKNRTPGRRAVDAMTGLSGARVQTGVDDFGNPIFAPLVAAPNATAGDIASEAQSRQENESLVDSIMKQGAKKEPAFINPAPAGETPSGQPDVKEKPAQTITGSNAQAGAEMPVQPEAQAKAGAAIPTSDQGAKIAENLGMTFSGEQKSLVPGQSPLWDFRLKEPGVQMFSVVVPVGTPESDIVKARDAKIQQLKESGDWKEASQKLNLPSVLEVDVQRYNQLFSELQAAPMEQRFAMSSEIERIKNKYGGKPPKLPSPEIPKETTSSAPAAQNRATPPNAVEQGGAAVVVSSGKPNGAKVEVQYEIVEAATLKPQIVRDVSLDQTRQRTGNAASDEQIAKIATAPDISLLSESPTSTVGAPILDDVVIAGNGRVSGIIAGYEGGTKGSHDYRRGVVESAKRLGLGDVSGMVNPVLIRRVKRYVSGDKASFVVESNPKYAALKESTPEAALLDAQALGDIGALPFNESGSLTAAGVQQVARLLDAAQRNLTRSVGGDFDANEANKRVQLAALATLAKENNVSITDLIGLIESDDGRRVMGEVTRVAPRLQKLDADLRVGGHILKGMRELQAGIASVRDGHYNSLGEWYAERKNELLKSGLDANSEGLLKVMVASQKKPTVLRELFEEYLKVAEYEQNQRKEAGQTADIFGESRKAATPEEIFARVFGTNGGQPAPVGNQPSQPAARVDLKIATDAGFKLDSDGSIIAFHGSDRDDIKTFNASGRRGAHFSSSSDDAVRYANDANKRNSQTPQESDVVVYEVRLRPKKIGRITFDSEGSPVKPNGDFDGIVTQEAAGDIEITDSGVIEIISVKKPTTPVVLTANKQPKLDPMPGFQPKAHSFKVGDKIRFTEPSKTAPPNDKPHIIEGEVVELHDDGGIQVKFPSLPTSRRVYPSAGIAEKIPPQLPTSEDKLIAERGEQAEGAPVLATDEEEAAFEKEMQSKFDKLDHLWLESLAKKYGSPVPPINPDTTASSMLMRANNMLERAADKSTDPVELARILEASKGIPEESRVAWAIANNPYASAETFEAAKINPATQRMTTVDNVERLDARRATLRAQRGLDKPETASQEAASTPFSVGSKVQMRTLDKNDKLVWAVQPWTILKETTDPKFPDERLFDVQNDKTKEIQRNIDQGSLRQVAERTAEERAAGKGKSKKDLQAELLALNPSYRTTIKDYSIAELKDLIAREKSKGDDAAANLGNGLPDGMGWDVAGIHEAVRGEDAAGFGYKIISRDDAVRITSRDEAAGYGGFFYKGKIYLVADNIARGNAENARQILREEVGHGLLRTPEGQALIIKALEEGKLQLTEAERQVLLKQGYLDENNQLLDEFVAKSARENRTWWQNIVDSVRAFLSKLGLKLSNEEVARLLLKQIRASRDGAVVDELSMSGIPAASRSGGMSAEQIASVNRELNALNEKQTKTAADNARIVELERQLGQEDLFSVETKPTEDAAKKKQREEIARRQNRRLVAGQIQDQGGLFAEKKAISQDDMFSAPNPKTPSVTPKFESVGNAEGVQAAFPTDTPEDGISWKKITVPGSVLYFEESDKMVWIVGVETEPKFRRQGKATELLKSINDYAKQTGRKVEHGNYTADGEKYLKHVNKRLENQNPKARNPEAGLFGDLAPSGTENPEEIRSQVGGVKGVGQRRMVENIAEIRDAVKEQVFNSTPAASFERTQNAWRLATELTDETLQGGYALQYKAAIGGQDMALPLLQVELSKYALKLAATGNDTLLRFMLDRSANFRTTTGGGRTTSGRDLRAAQEFAGSPALRWLQSAMTSERHAAAQAGARIIPQEMFLRLAREFENLNMTADELEAFVTGNINPENPLAGVFGVTTDAPPAGTPRSPRTPRGDQGQALPGFENMLENEASREAFRMLDRYQRSQTEWLRPETQRSLLRIIVDEAIGENRLARYGQEDFIQRLSARFQEINVPPDIANELAFEVWKDKSAREATRTARAIAADEAFEERNATALLNRFQTDQTEWLNTPRKSEASRLVKEFLKESATGVTNDVRVERLMGDLVSAGVSERVARQLADEAGRRKEVVLANARLAQATMSAEESQRVAEGILDRLENRHSGVEWLRPNSSVNEVREIIKTALKGRLGYDESTTTIDPILDDPTRIVEKIQAALENAGVEPETARALGREVETERKTRWTNQRAAKMERAAGSKSIRSLIESILSTPYRAQHDPEWRRETSIRWFESNGLAREQAEAAATLFNDQFEAAMKVAADKIAKAAIADGRPRTDSQLERLIRAGVLDPSKHWVDQFAEQTGWKIPTKEQFAKLVELEDKIADPALSPSEVHAFMEQQMTILRHIGKRDGSGMRALAESFTASLLSSAVVGGRTFTVQLAPMVTMIRDFAVKSVLDPKNALNFARAIKNSYINNLNHQVRFGWQKNAFQFHINEIEHSYNELQRVHEETSAVIASKTASFARKGIARLQQVYALQRLVFRLLNTLDNAQMSAGKEWKLVFYASRAFKEAGINSSQKVGELVDWMQSVRQSAYEKAKEAGLDDLTASVRADNEAAEAAYDFTSNNTNSNLANQAWKAAENDVYSVVGRRAPGIGESDEGFLSKPMNFIMAASSDARSKGGLESIGTTLAVGMINIPFRAARFASEFYGYGLVRYGIDHYRTTPGRQWIPGMKRNAGTFWKQSFATELQAKHRRNMALASLAVMAVALGNAMKSSTSDDDAGEEKFGVYITGGGPKNKALRDEWIKAGWRPYSIHFVMNGVGIRKLTIPLTRVGEGIFPPFLGAAVVDTVKWRQKEAQADGKEINFAKETTIQMLGAHLQLLQNRGIFQTVSQYQRLAEGGAGFEKNVARLAGSTVSAAAIPFKSAISAVTDAILGPMDNSSAQLVLANQFPVIGLPWQQKAVNRFGDELYDSTWYGKVERLGYPISFQIAPTPENKRIYPMLLEKGVGAPELRRYALEEKYGQLTDDQFADFAIKSGALLKGSVTKNIAAIEKMTPEAAKDFVANAAQQADRIAASALALKPVPKESSAPAPQPSAAAVPATSERRAAQPTAPVIPSRAPFQSAPAKQPTASGRVRSSLASYKTPKLRKPSGRIRSRISSRFKKLRSRKPSRGRLRARMGLNKSWMRF